MQRSELLATLRKNCSIAAKQGAIDSFAANCGGGASLRDCSLAGMDLSGLCFVPLRLVSVDLNTCTAAGAQFAALIDCDLSDARFESCSVISIRECRMLNTRIIRTNVLHEFRSNTCSGAGFEEVAFGGVCDAGRSAAIERSNFVGATISGSWLSGLLVRECEFGSAKFVDCVLARASLHGCGLRDANVTQCNLIDTRFEECEMAGMESRSCVARDQDIAWLKERSCVISPHLWSGVDDVLRGAAGAITSEGDCRLRWMMRHKAVVTQIVLWTSGTKRPEGAVVWTRDRDVIRVYSFKNVQECEEALSEWWRDCAMWALVHGSLEVDDPKAVSGNSLRHIKNILQMK